MYKVHWHVQRRGAKGGAPPAAAVLPGPAEHDSDPDLEDQDYAMFEEFGSRVEFLQSLELTSPQPGHQPNANVPASQQAHSVTRANSAATAEQWQLENAHVAATEAASAPESAGEDDASEDNAEAADYERSARVQQQASQADRKADVLPVKLPGGKLHYEHSQSHTPQAATGIVLQHAVEGISISEDPQASKQERSAAHDAPEVPRKHDGAPMPAPPPPPPRIAAARRPQWQARLAALRDAQAYHSRTEHIASAKEQMAAAASKLLEDPQANLGHLRLLLELGIDDDAQARCPAMLARGHNPHACHNRQRHGAALLALV